MQIRPINNFVILKLDETPEKTASGLYIPDKARMPKSTGTVKAVGRGILMMTGHIQPPQLKVGDRVFILVNPEDFKKIEFDGEECVVLPDESQILGILAE
jgi:chaperonin GroES